MKNQAKISRKILVGALLLALIVMARNPLPAYASSYAGSSINGHSVQYATIDTSNTFAEVMLANGAINSAQSLAGMAADNGAFAAINGTYFSAYDGNPIPWGTVIRNGKLLHTGGGAVVGITDSGKLLLDRLDFSIYGYVNGEEQFRPWRINHDCDASDAVVIYTSEYSGKITPHTGAKTVLVGSDGKVSSITANAFTVPSGGFAVVFNSKLANRANERFNVGDVVTYDFTYETTFTKAEDWANVKQALGAGPSLIINGTVTADGTAEGFTEAKINTNRAGRSFIGAKADGTIIIGNISNVTLKEAAAVCQKMSLVNAMCLDGGGSVALYYNGSKTAGRNINNALGFFTADKLPISVYINGTQMSFAQAPYVANNTTMVPMRGIFEALSATVNYDASTKKITAYKGGTSIELTLGQKTALINKQAKTLTAAAAVKNGSTMVPLRFVSEALAATVNWDSTARTITISTQD
jgi:exopolysaccharide biosynthesis protein